MRTLIAIPVYNEERHVRDVLDAVMAHVGNVLVIDDGSTDRTPEILKEYPIDVIRHAVNRGYGRSIRDAFLWAMADGYDWLITMDCDKQHEPGAIPDFLEAAARNGTDIISGSRYLAGARPEGASLPVPEDRRAINREVTADLNRILAPALGTLLTDAFCGYKAYRVSALKSLTLDEDGYAFPMQFWVQAAAHGLRLREIPVPLIYNDPARTFGGPLDDPTVRLKHYRDVMCRELRRCAPLLPWSAQRDPAIRRGCR